MILISQIIFLHYYFKDQNLLQVVKRIKELFYFSYLSWWMLKSLIIHLVVKSTLHANIVCKSRFSLSCTEICFQSFLSLQTPQPHPNVKVTIISRQPNFWSWMTIWIMYYLIPVDHG